MTYESTRIEDIKRKERRISGKVLGHVVVDFCNKFELEKNLGLLQTTVQLYYRRSMVPLKRT